ncbi:Hypothetical_protein [Hexamita inflata]|uniref:Hypothetical_protein n=1 Tax=Hexamita inflata TaxID=28002 RepID=A0AA86Q7Y5_9EUKA|nr:Hypothetical protein HINF_LOCUS35482 [Hexamita inflata]
MVNNFSGLISFQNINAFKDTQTCSSLPALVDNVSLIYYEQQKTICSKTEVVLLIQQICSWFQCSQVNLQDFWLRSAVASYKSSILEHLSQNLSSKQCSKQLDFNASKPKPQLNL